MVVTFFESYLVECHTSYVWNGSTLEPFRADVGVGQGSALSPVLSALVIAPIMKLFRLRPEGKLATLILYMDNGTTIVQSCKIEENCVHLYHAYQCLFEMFTKAGLVLEHDKTELFHFDRGHTEFNMPLDLGYAPYTGATPLKPKQYW